MVREWLIRPKLLVFIPLLLLLLIAVACGAEVATPTPQPTATPQPILAPEEIRSLVSEAVKAAIPPPAEVVSAAEIQKIVKAAIPATPTPAPTATPAPALDPRALVVAARYGGVVPMSAFAEPGTFDAHQASGNHEIVAVSPIYNQLIEFLPIDGRQTEVVGDLAESWVVSDDGKAFTFTLRKGVKWHDGKPLTVDDAVFSLQRMVEEGAPRPKTGRLRGYIDRVEKVDQNTLTVHLKFPSNAFLRFLVVDFMKILPKHSLEAGVDLGNFNNAMGTGPFMPVTWDKGISIELTKNPDYFLKEQPFFDGIKGFFITDKSAEIAAFKTERVLMGMQPITHFEVSDFITLENDNEFTRKFKIWFPKAGAVVGLVVNTKVKPFDDPRVRKALHLALHRQPIVDFIGKGKFLLGSPMAPGGPLTLPEEELLTIPGYRELDGKKHPDDIAEAKRLWAEAGLGDNEKFNFVYGDLGIFRDMSVLIKEQYKEIFGLDLELIAQQIPAWFTRMGQGDFEMGQTGYAQMVLDPDDRFQAMFLDRARNWSKWTDPEVDALFAKQTRETDFEKRKELVFEMQRKILLGSPGTLDIMHITFGVPVSKRIHNFVTVDTLGIIHKHAHEWIEQE